jgi:hypothetical protein
MDTTIVAEDGTTLPATFAVVSCRVTVTWYPLAFASE